MKVMDKGVVSMMAAILVSMAILLGCPKETPTPDPTPVPVPTEQPTILPGSEAVCARAYSIGGSSTVFYECRDVVGDKVDCPENPEALEKCAE